MAIVWREQMNVGVKAVDDGNQQLVSLMNTLEQALSRSPDLYGEHEAAVRTVLGRLHSLAHDHFTREERLQKAADYAGFDENHRDHQRITKQLGQIISRYEEGAHGQNPVTAPELLKFLHDWLIDHIIRIDLKMRGHQFPSNVW